MVKNLTCNAGDAGLIPGWGTKIPHATELLSLCTTREPRRAHATPGSPARHVSRRLLPAGVCVSRGMAGACQPLWLQEERAERPGRKARGPVLLLRVEAQMTAILLSTESDRLFARWETEGN